jgi:ABC-type oligopeptide transport system substrate-binding subunit
MIGTVLNGRYRLEAEIGRGGMGVVYRAHDTLLDRDVAVKILSEATPAFEGRARLLHEAQAAAQLNHPNIVSVYDAGEVEGTPFVVMELLQGPSLCDWRPGSLDQILVIARQVCAALEHAHAHGIVHRDLKPENVLLAPDGTAKLSDFGLARTVSSRLTAEGTILGTVFYLAPEQALGHQIDGRADLYALGVMLYELTTGELPFTGDDPIAVISQHLHAHIIPPHAKNAHVPPVLDALIIALLSKDPEGRPGSAAQVLGILSAPDILDREAMSLDKLSVLERIRRGRMVGRERELQQARELWSGALSGQGQTLLISGEPGVGKTRLVQELSTQVQVSGGRVLQGACYAEGGMPYSPFARIIHAVLVGDMGQHLELPEFVLADLITVAPALRLSYPEIKPTPPLKDLQAERYRLFENLAVFFTALSERFALLMLLEDIQWADSGTLFLLRYLARHMRRQRVLFVATCQDVATDEARRLHEVLLDLDRERLAKRLKLLRLDRERTKELLAVLFAEEITPEFLEGIYRETEGNPFFIEEVCKALVESGKLYYEDGRWHRPSIEELGIPQSLRVAIESRVRGLPAAAQETLCLAAVLGRTFGLESLMEASELDEEVLLDALECAQNAQLIEVVSTQGSALEGWTKRHGIVSGAPQDAVRFKAGTIFSFVHGLIPNTLVEGLSTRQSRRLHRQAAVAIERLHPSDYEALAYHYDQAGDIEKATHYLVKAGDRARQLYTFQEAIGHYRRALTLLKEKGEQERVAETLMRLGLVYTAAFEPDKAREAYDEAFDLWEPLRKAREPVTPQGSGRVLHLAVEEPLTLDPARISDDVSTFIAAQLFEGLVRMDADYNVLPGAAARWKVADRGRRYTFRLREGLRWNDGSPLTAEHFEAAWQRNLRLDPPAPYAHLLYVIENARAFSERRLDDPEKVGVRAVDDHTLEIRLEETIAYLPQLLAQPIAYPLPPWIVQSGQELWADGPETIGNGAYRLEEWRRGERLVLSRNSFYQGRFPGNVERVECPVIRDFGLALNRYAAGALDAVNMISAGPAVVARARVAFGHELVFTPHASTLYLAFRADRSPLDDVRVRQAFAHALDRDALVHEASEGQYLPANGGFIPPGMPAHSPGIGLAYDVERARELLAQAGYPGGEGFPAVSWLYFGASADEPVVPFMQRAWRENLGLDLQAQGMEWAELQTRRKLDPPHLSLIGWSADVPDPDGFLRATYHSREGINAACSGWRNARFDALVEEAACVTDPVRRMALYQAADRILVCEETAIMPLFYAQGRILIKPWVMMPRVPAVLLNLKDIVLDREEG